MSSQRRRRKVVFDIDQTATNKIKICGSDRALLDLGSNLLSALVHQSASFQLNVDERIIEVTIEVLKEDKK